MATRTPSSSSSALKKGARIKFVGGKYTGRGGWLDNGRDPTDSFTPVVVKLKNDKEKVTKVLHENYVLRTELADPTSYEEAAFQQHADIDRLLTLLCKNMAECEMLDSAGNSGTQLSRIFLERLLKAQTRQTAKGDAARWRRVRWPRS
jgi:hypothetical protein